MKRAILVLSAAFWGCNGSSLYDQRSGVSGQPGNGGAEAPASLGSGGSPASSSSPPGTGGILNGDGTTGLATGVDAGGAPVSAAGGSIGSGAGGAPSGDWDSAADPGVRSDSSATGSAVGSGGATGSGGASATVGTAGVTGAIGTGGVQGSGGTSTTAPSGAGGIQGTGGTTGAGGSSGSCVPAANPGSSAMNAGQACVSCHGSRQSPTITLGGTVYGSATGGSGVSGATVTITDNSGKKTTLVTGASGNFYTGTSIAFPATVQISKCPDTVSMGTTITTGDCNSCHGSSMRIHLP